jgi:hypothetical protein
MTDNPTRQLVINVPSFLSAIIVLALVVGIVYALAAGQPFLATLQNIEQARGLITFLITVTTIGIAILLAVSTLFGTAGDDQDKRFDRGKQVLSIMIGIMGTIVGFYFGTSQAAQSSTGQSPVVTQQQGPTISSVTASKLDPKKGEPFMVSFSISGGKAPYKYTITFEPTVPGLAPISKDATTAGPVKQEFTVPDSLDADKDVTYRIKVTDSDNKPVESTNKDGSQKLSLKTK